MIRRQIRPDDLLPWQDNGCGSDGVESQLYALQRRVEENETLLHAILVALTPAQLLAVRSKMTDGDLSAYDSGVGAVMLVADGVDE